MGDASTEPADVPTWGLNRNWGTVTFGSYWQDLIPYFGWVQANAGRVWLSYIDWPIACDPPRSPSTPATRS